MKKILIVDDEKDLRELLKERLERYDYLVTTASNGQEALNICKADRPDLILMDIVMPVMDGYEACEKLKQDIQTKDIPILLSTGKDLDPQGIIERYRNMETCGYISKLSTFQELLGKIKEFIG